MYTRFHQLELYNLQESEREGMETCGERKSKSEKERDGTIEERERRKAKERERKKKHKLR